MLLGEGQGYFETFAALLTAARSHGPRVHDARIAAICLNQGAREPWTADRDFLAFPQLKVTNPLVG